LCRIDDDGSPRCKNFTLDDEDDDGLKREQEEHLWTLAQKPREERAGIRQRVVKAEVC